MDTTEKVLTLILIAVVAWQGVIVFTRYWKGSKRD